ncbi:hypothetical protein GOODEAATRI_018762 [Goodea atripinnis]|uniref:Reverse transcriptase domain-containing protein n=1 Tax=Goodea atripinnis TaxID=208336 RepID=A0ABV0NVY1_9TELE
MSHFKYVDDMALVAHMTGTEALSQYQNTANTLTKTFIDISLELNILKTKNDRFWMTLIESTLTFNILSWYNFLPVKYKTKLSHTINQASTITGLPQTRLFEPFKSFVLRKATLITEDPPHPLPAAPIKQKA